MPTAKPMKFPNEEVKAVDIPWDNGIEWVSSRKFDGNRGMCVNGELFTSNMPKQPRNELLLPFMDSMIKLSSDRGWVFDYELFDPFQEYHAQTSGIINSYRKPLPEMLGVYVFDAMPIESFRDGCVTLPFSKRIEIYHDLVDLLPERFHAVKQRKCSNAEWALKYFRRDLKNGDEGSVIRAKNILKVGKKMLGGYYKHGRMTINQCGGYKLKEYLTVDGVIIGVQQRLKMKEGIPREIDGNGYMKRPGGKDSYELDDCLGALIVKVTDDGDHHGTETEIGFGRGFSLDVRRKMWKNRDALIGKHCEFSHMPHGGKDKGRLRIGKLLKMRPDKD